MGICGRTYHKQIAQGPGVMIMGKARNLYPVYNVNIRLEEAIEVDLPVLEGLADRYNCPHFYIVDYLSNSKVKNGTNLHFTYLPYCGVVVAFEENPEAQA